MRLPEALRHRRIRRPTLTKATIARIRKAGKIAKWTFMVLLGITLALLIARFTAIPLLLFLDPNLDSLFFDMAMYGPYPEQTYVSFPLASPRSSVLKWDERCNNGLVLLDIHGNSVSTEGPLIMDMKGELVWITGSYGLATNLKVQKYKGEDYLTFWAGKKTSSAFGRGKYYMLDSSYNMVHRIEAEGWWYMGDLHEFAITDNDTALMTIYDPYTIDFTGTPMEWIRNDGLIVDNLIQEVDIATGKLLFEWRASDYIFEIANVSYGGYVEGSTTGLDYFHINSIQKDSHGNLLVSARFVHKILCIDGRTGDILWAFGGDSTDFEDLSDGAASDFKWQHDVHWVDEAAGILGLFDNGVAFGPHWTDSDYSSGKLIKLDVEARTASLIRSYSSLYSFRSKSQGNMQILPADNDSKTSKMERVFIGWGSSAAYTEYDIEGEALCETHFSASMMYKQEPAKSYRAIKADWHGTPYYPPAAKIKKKDVYVSWNGATEVASWTLQGTRAENAPEAADEDFEDLVSTEKESFETRIPLKKRYDKYTSLRVAAVDANGEILRHSNLATFVSVPWYKSPWWALIPVVAIGALLLFFRATLSTFGANLLRRLRKVKVSASETKYHRLDADAEEAISMHDPR